MAKKKTSSPQQQNGSSSVNVNTFSKGMNKDVAPSFEGQQAWWHARNAANNSEDGDLGIIGNAVLFLILLLEQYIDMVMNG